MNMMLPSIFLIFPYSSNTSTQSLNLNFMGGVPWTEEEDQLLRNCIKLYGEGKWHRVPTLAGLKRCRKSCRLRWLNYLRPNIKRGSFTQDEVELIIEYHKIVGNKWSVIAANLPGRTANDLKNFWNCHLSKTLTAEEMTVHKDKIQNCSAVSRIRHQEIGSSTSTICPNDIRDVAHQEFPVAVEERDVVPGDLPEEFQLDEAEINGIGSSRKWDWDDLDMDVDIDHIWNDSS